MHISVGCLDVTLTLCDIIQKPMLGGSIGYRDPYFEYIFCHSKFHQLQAVIHDAAVAVVVASGESSGYCYMIRLGPNSCLLGHETGLLICLLLKLFLPSIFISVNF